VTIDSIGYKAANMAIRRLLVSAIPVRSGGSIPIVALFEKNKKQNNLMGFGLEQRCYSLAKRTFRIFNTKESKLFRCTNILLS
jgi:hypothetical protein